MNSALKSHGDTFDTLPALKHLGELASLKPVIVIDSREQRPLESWAYWFAREVVEAANALLRGHRQVEGLHAP